MRIVFEVEVEGEGKEFEAVMDQAVADGKVNLIRVVYTNSPLGHCLIDGWTEASVLIKEYLEKNYAQSKTI